MANKRTINKGHLILSLRKNKPNINNKKTDAQMYTGPAVEG